MLLRNHAMMMPQQGGYLREDDGPCVYETNISSFCQSFDPSQGYYWTGVYGMPDPHQANELFTAYSHECHAKYGNYVGVTVGGYRYFSGFASGWSFSNYSTGIQRTGAFDYFSGESLAGCPAQGEGWGWAQVNWDDLDFTTGIFYPREGAYDYIDYAPRTFLGYPNDAFDGKGWADAWREENYTTGVKAGDEFDYDVVSNVGLCNSGYGFENPWTDDDAAFGIRATEDYELYTLGTVVGYFGLGAGTGWAETWLVS